MTGITVGQAGDVLVAVKQAHDPDHRARLRHEADLLGRLDHPGVVRFVDYDEGPPAALRTAFVGPDSWRTSHADAAAFAALTATIADLHESGLAHGDLRADHVLLDRDQRPILCGFADAGPATSERVNADRLALASMLRDEASRHPSGTGHRMRDAAEALEEPALPTRAAIRLLDDKTPSVSTPHRPRPRAGAIAAAVAALVIFAVAAVAVGGRPESTSTAASIDGTEMPVPTPRQPTTTVPPTTDPVHSAEPVEPAEIIVHDGRRYGVGAEGDLVVVADWDCTGVATPAVLRPDTGELAIFATWPGPDATALPATTVVIDDAFGFIIDDGPCPELRVRTPSGSRLVEVSS